MAPHFGRPGICICVRPDKPSLFHLAHKNILFAIADIDNLWKLPHNSPMNPLARDPKQIGNVIRRTRKKQGLSQSDLGSKAGLRQETISLIESGHPSAKLETLLAILAALDLEFRIGARSKGSEQEIENLF